jgi:pSer/pThr/pTyr-binding forkhead associated (FHA) protein
MAIVVLKFKDQVIKEYMATEAPITIGRARECTIVVDNPTVSKRHAKIEYVNGAHILTDLDSTNGTLINGKKIKQVTLKDDDKVTIGKHSIVYMVEEEIPNEEEFMDFGSATMVLNPSAPPPREEKKSLPEKRIVRPIVSLEPAKRAKLFIFTSDVKKEYMLSKDVTTIGKSPDCDIVINGFLVPKIAAIIKQVEGSYSISECGGWVSVKVNGKKIGKNTKLEKNDSVDVSGVKLIFK